jgi:hypothetical protein
MAKLWIGLPVALAALLWVISRATAPVEFHPWDAIVSVASTITSILLGLLLISVGGKLLVSLFRIARNDPDRIVRNLPWLFEGDGVRPAKKS